MKKIAVLYLIALALISGCGGGGEEAKQQSAKGGVNYGGVFNINEEEDFRNLFPLRVTEVVSQRIANQVYEGLITINQEDLSLQPGLAESWEVNENATVFTFKLRKGIHFQDDPCFPEGKGREVKASDFKYCMTKLCESDAMNAGFKLVKDRIVGATDYYNSTMAGEPLADGVPGLKVIDDYTFQVELESSFSGFINIMAMPFTWVFPKEAVDKYGVDMRIKCVGTGPFRVKEVKEGDVVILVRNENYWGKDKHGNKLPYLDAIKFTFVKEKKSEFLEFKKQNLDMVFRLPVEMIDEILEELKDAKGNLSYELQIETSMSTQYYGFLHADKVFKDIRVRKAFNYAIDRQKIINYTLKGEGRAGNHGFVPPAFKRSKGDSKGYDAEKINGYEYNPDKAKQLLADAGYPNGQGFPEVTLQLNSGEGPRNIKVAEVAQHMLNDNLGITVNLNVMPFAQHLENVESAKAKFWRAAWLADYADPENFLNLFYGAHVPASLSEKSFMNTFRYKSDKFDEIFELALAETDEKKRMELYMQADQILMDDAACIVLFYDENYRLLQKKVKNFPINSMEYRKLNEVYFDTSDNSAPAPGEKNAK